jgi:hypothetical protein
MDPPKYLVDLHVSLNLVFLAVPIHGPSVIQDDIRREECPVTGVDLSAGGYGFRACEGLHFGAVRRANVREDLVSVVVVFTGAYPLHSFHPIVIDHADLFR